MARRTFFSFQYKPDVTRAWNVRNSWVTKVTQGSREDAGFFDSSVFEASEREDPETLKSVPPGRFEEHKRDMRACWGYYDVQSMGALRNLL
jgi:hypothetical protein